VDALPWLHTVSQGRWRDLFIALCLQHSPLSADWRTFPSGAVRDVRMSKKAKLFQGILGDYRQSRYTMYHSSLKPAVRQHGWVSTLLWFYFFRGQISWRQCNWLSWNFAWCPGVFSPILGTVPLRAPKIGNFEHVGKTFECKYLKNGKSQRYVN